jgi:hypothetical protein
MAKQTIRKKTKVTKIKKYAKKKAQSKCKSCGRFM